MNARLFSRRRLVAGAAAWLGAAPLLAAEPPTGWVRPRLAVPAWSLTGSDGRRHALPALLHGKVTALQLMFTGCPTSCPIQGALFAAFAAKLPPQGFQLLSISVDALADDPAALAAWLERHGRTAQSLQHWQALVPPLAEVDRIASLLRGVPAAAGTHTAQVFVVDRSGRLAYRTGDTPDVPFLAALLAHVAREG